MQSSFSIILKCGTNGDMFKSGSCLDDMNLTGLSEPLINSMTSCQFIVFFASYSVSEAIYLTGSLRVIL